MTCIDHNLSPLSRDELIFQAKQEARDAALEEAIQAIKTHQGILTTSEILSKIANLKGAAGPLTVEHRSAAEAPNAHEVANQLEYYDSSKLEFGARLLIRSAITLLRSEAVTQTVCAQERNCEQYTQGWNDCRADMLKTLKRMGAHNGDA